MKENGASWNSICSDSIRKEKAEIAKRYDIRFGQMEIYCARCGRPVSKPLKHMCQDIRLRTVRNEKKRQKEQALINDAVGLIKGIGRTKVATMLELDVKTISNWIDRGKIPVKYQGKVFEVCQTRMVEGDVCI